MLPDLFSPTPKILFGGQELEIEEHLANLSSHLLSALSEFNAQSTIFRFTLENPVLGSTVHFAQSTGQKFLVVASRPACYHVQH